MRYRSRHLVALLLALFPCAVLAQSSNADPPSSTSDPEPASAIHSPNVRAPHDAELTFYTGQAFGYPLIMSSLKGQRLFVLGIRYRHYWYAFRDTNVNWNADSKPMTLYSNDIHGPREYTYGGSLTMGAQFVPHTHWRWQPVLDVDEGMIAFTKDTPVPDTRRLNLTFNFGPGVYIPVNGTQALKLGAWFYHFSDAFTAARNPNMDTFLVYAGFTFRNIALFHRKD